MMRQPQSASYNTNRSQSAKKPSSYRTPNQRQNLTHTYTPNKSTIKNNNSNNISDAAPQHMYAKTSTTNHINSSTPGIVRPNASQNNSTSELTFKPKVRALPSGIYGTSRNSGTPGRVGNDDLSFDERSHRALKERETKMSERRQAAKEKEMEGEHKSYCVCVRRSLLS